MKCQICGKFCNRWNVGHPNGVGMCDDCHIAHCVGLLFKYPIMGDWLP